MAYRRDDVVVRAFATQSVDPGFNPLVESYQKTLKNSIHSFPAWRSAFRGCGEQAGKLLLLPDPFRGMGAWRKTMEPQKPQNSPGPEPEFVKR